MFILAQLFFCLCFFSVDLASAAAGTNGITGSDITVRGHLGTKALDVAATNDAGDVVDLINGSESYPSL